MKIMFAIVVMLSLAACQPARTPVPVEVERPPTSATVVTTESTVTFKYINTPFGKTLRMIDRETGVACYVDDRYSAGRLKWSCAKM
jgi:hypothetical protein